MVVPAWGANSGGELDERTGLKRPFALSLLLFICLHLLICSRVFWARNVIGRTILIGLEWVYIYIRGNLRKEVQGVLFYFCLHCSIGGRIFEWIAI